MWSSLQPNKVIVIVQMFQVWPWWAWLYTLFLQSRKVYCRLMEFDAESLLKENTSGMGSLLFVKSEALYPFFGEKSFSSGIWFPWIIYCVEICLGLVRIVLDMSLGQGHGLKCKGQNEMARNFVFILCSVTCLQHVLKSSHMPLVSSVAFEMKKCFVV